MLVAVSGHTIQADRHLAHGNNLVEARQHLALHVQRGGDCLRDKERERLEDKDFRIITITWRSGDPIVELVGGTD